MTLVQFNSNQFGSDKFPHHGFCTANVETWQGGQVIRGKTTGPFNVEAEAAIAETRTEILKFVADRGRYAQITEWSGSMLCSLEALQIAQQSLKDAYSTQAKLPCAVAWVAGDDVDGVSIVVGSFERTYGEIGIPFQLFANLALAEDWVRHMFQVEE